MDSRMQISAGWNVLASEKRKMVINSWRKIFTSTVVKADAGVDRDTERSWGHA